MKSSTRVRRLVGLAGVALLSVAVISCSSTADDTESPVPSPTDTSVTDETGDTDTPSDEPSAAVAAAIDFVAESLNPPEFDSLNPVDTSGAAGKSLFIVDLDSSIPIIQTADAATKEALALVGATVTTFDGKGSVSEFAHGVNEAIAQDADVIALFAIDPRAVEGPLRTAHDAGIVTMAVQFDDPDAPLPDYLDAQSTYCYSCAGEMMANAIVAAENGAPVGVNLVISSEVSNAPTLVDKFTETLEEGCPDCNLVVSDIPVASWQTDIATQVNSNLNNNPDLRYVVPIYDGMAPFAVSSIQTSGKTDVKVVTFNATPSIMTMLQQGQVVMTEVGSPQAWQGWDVADQFLRLIAGEQPKELGVGLRLFDSSNINDIDLDAPEATWYEVDFERVYKAAWGVN